MSMDSDEALYARVKQGDMGAFDDLYARSAPRLFGFLLPQLPTRADAEDVFHESLLATLESAEVTFDRGGFRTWLYRIARNRVLNRMRSHGRGEVAFAKLAPLEESSVSPADETAAHGQLLRALDGAVSRLPSPLSEIYRLRTSGLTYEEMATVLN